MIRGLGKVPTTFSMDVAALDEVDDIEPRMLKFVRGRLTASELRFVLKIGTQRVHGRGMNKAWKEGSQGVFVFTCPKCGRIHNAEEEFPQIVRMKRGEAGNGLNIQASNIQAPEKLQAGNDTQLPTFNAQRLTPNAQHSTLNAQCSTPDSQLSPSAAGAPGTAPAIKPNHQRADAVVGAPGAADGARLCPAARDQSQQRDLQPPHAEAQAASSSHVAAAGLRHSRAPGTGDADERADREIGAPGTPLAVLEAGAPGDGAVPGAESITFGVPPLGGSGEPRERGTPNPILAPVADSVVGAPKLTWAGDFKLDGDDGACFSHEPGNEYFLGCVGCGAVLDRTKPIAEHRRKDLIEQRKWSFRISQLAIGAIDLAQIVGRFQLAVADPEEMIVFRCDVLGLPQSSAQALTPAVMDRARSVEVFDLAPTCREGHLAFGGLDMGDRCWLFAREVLAYGHHPGGQLAGSQLAGGVLPDGHHLNQFKGAGRLLAAERISAGDVVGRAQYLFQRLSLTALFIDERPLVNEARSLALALNGLQNLAYWPRIADVRNDYVSLPGGLAWDGKNSRWVNLKCAVVRFTKNCLGAGIEQSVVFFEEGGQTKFVPCIACNRFETIDRVVREFLTPDEGVVEVVNGKVRETPGLLLPRVAPGHPPILDLVDAHLIAGSERGRRADGGAGDYVDGCENHLLLADGYSKLAEVVCGGNRNRFAPGKFILWENSRRSRAVMGRRNRALEG
ncbi:MAG: hypothetical protein P4N60_01700 [Verrucomicrobiae bacterium]|nr:hypothetical protein [Verrucomicrobiae bacterium]